MAFADAVFDGTAVLEGLSACRVETPDGLRRVLDDGGIPLAFGRLEQFSNVEAWSAIIDARMRKRAVPERQRGLAPVTIGLGPNFVAGENVDLAVETSWGDRLGTVVTSGATFALQGEPQAIGGAARERFVYAPVAGRFETSRRIADHVEQDEVVATITGVTLRAPFGGILRGLTHDGVDLAAGTKVIEVDPRNDPAAAFGLGARPKRIAEGVVAALKSTSVALR